jgi:integrase
MYYLHYFENGIRHRISLQTTSLQLAREKQRQFESARVRGITEVFPTRTPLGKAVAAYVDHMEVVKTKRGMSSDRSYLRSAFGQVCPQLEPGRRSRRVRMNTDAVSLLKAAYLEQITSEQVGQFIREKVRSGGIQPKTANRYREVLSRLFSWSMKQNGVRMPGGINPAAQVERYRESAPRIRFLKMKDIREQLAAFGDDDALRTLVAVYIYAGLRREEALWLTPEDVDLQEGRHGVIRVQAKLVKDEFWEPKTKVNRVVPISAALRSHLDQYLRTVVPRLWFFPNATGGRWDADGFSRKLRRVNCAAGLPWSSLDFRHTFGSHLAMKGESLYKISTLMGNSPDICRRHYATLLPESLVDAVEFDDCALPDRPVPHLRLI